MYIAIVGDRIRYPRVLKRVTRHKDLGRFYKKLYFKWLQKLFFLVEERCLSLRELGRSSTRN